MNKLFRFFLVWFVGGPLLLMLIGWVFAWSPEYGLGAALPALILWASLLAFTFPREIGGKHGKPKR